MKINFILPSIFKSGGSRVIFEYSNFLKYLGFDVVVYYPVLPQDFYRNEYSFRRVINYCRDFKNNISNIWYKNYYKHSFSLKKVLFLNEIFIRKADFTIATAWPTSFFVNKIKLNKGHKVYYIQAYENWNSNLKLVNISYKLPLNQITISSYLADFFIKKFKTNPHVINIGLDKNIFFFENSSKKFILKKILFIDYGQKQKNVAKLIPIIENLKQNYPQLEFLSFGLKNHTKKPIYIKFFENPDDSLIRKLYNEADLFIFPSLSEGFGLPPAEAMACKCAVATTAVGAIPEYVTDGETGFIIRNNDLTDLPEIIGKIINDQKKLKEVSENGYNKVHEYFDWNKTVHQFTEYLTKLKNL